VDSQLKHLLKGDRASFMAHRLSTRRTPHHKRLAKVMNQMVPCSRPVKVTMSEGNYRGSSLLSSAIQRNLNQHRGLVPLLRSCHQQAPPQPDEKNIRGANIIAEEIKYLTGMM